MKKFLNKILHIHLSAIMTFAWLFGSIILFEYVLRISSGLSVFSVDIVFVLLFSCSLALVYTAFCLLLPPKVSRFFCASFIFITMIVYMIQIVFYVIFGTFCTVRIMLNGSEALEFTSSISSGIFSRLISLIIMLIPLTLYFIFGFRRPAKRSPVVSVVCVTASVVIHVITLLIIFAFGKDYFSPYDFYYNMSTPSQSVNCFGVYTAMRLDIKDMIMNPDSSSSEIVNDLPDLSSSEHILSSAEASSAALSSSLSSSKKSTSSKKPDLKKPISQNEKSSNIKSPNPGYSFKYPFDSNTNKMNVDFDALNKSESNKDIISINNYVKSVTATNKNEYSGIYKGYNFIHITAEAFAPYAIDKELTPTLYHMVNNGYKFTNFYTPFWGNTSEGEYVNMIGLLPRRSGRSLAGTTGKSMIFAFGSQLRQKGYSANAYHNHKYNYYDRNITHPDLGYNYKGAYPGGGLDVKIQWPESDLEMMQLSVQEYIDNRPFHAYYMTVSGHFEYKYPDNSIAQKNRKLVDHLDLPTACKVYLAANIELDRALENLLDQLRNAGIADKTLIVMSNDHYPYGLTNSEISAFLGHTVDPVFELSESTLLMYVDGMQPKTIDKLCSSVDIVPTVSNMLGLPFDSRMLSGRDIFSDADPIVMFPNRGWITNYARFDPKTKKVTQLGKTAVTAQYVSDTHKRVSDSFLIADKILSSNYYSKFVN